MPDGQEEPTEHQVSIEWHVPDSLVSHYVHNMVVQHGEHEFIISFFVTKPPLLIGVPTKEILETLKSVKAECVAQVIVAPERLPKFIDALKTNLATWQSKQASTSENKEE